MDTPSTEISSIPPIVPGNVDTTPTPPVATENVKSSPSTPEKVEISSIPSIVPEKTEINSIPSAVPMKVEVKSNPSNIPEKVEISSLPIEPEEAGKSLKPFITPENVETITIAPVVHKSEEYAVPANTKIPVNEPIPLTEPSKSTDTASSVNTTTTNDSTVRSSIENTTTKTHEELTNHDNISAISIHNPPSEHIVPMADVQVPIPSNENIIRPSTHHRPGSAKKKLTRPEMIQSAKDLAAAEHLGAGKSFYRTTMKDIAELGVGLQLYFLFTKYMSGCFFVMTLLALPALIMHGTSHGVDTQMIDPLRLSLYTIANGGVNSTSNATTQWCLDNPFTQVPTTVSSIVTACDLLHSVAFALFIWYFQHTTKAVIAMQADAITPAKYAIFVRGLPRSATVESIIAHFNQRYNPLIDRKDYPMTLGCFGRGKSTNLLPNLTHSGQLSKPVNNTDHLISENPIYLNTHIAEVSIAHASGGLLRTFLAMEYLTAKVAELEDILKTLQASSDEVKSPKESKQREKNIAKFEKELEKVQMTLDKKTNKMKQLRSKGASYVDDCECAFVVFNSVEAQKRCLRDYRMSCYSILRHFQPKELQFEGKYPLKIRQAPEPSNIIWENLEVPVAERRLRRYFTNFITFLLLLLSCGIISLAQSAQAKFSSVTIPSFCNEALPAIFTGNYSNISKYTWNLYWNQFPTNTTCPTGSYYISYVNGIAVKEPAVGNATQCLNPCLSTQSNIDSTCSTLPCFKPQLEDIKTRPCTTYKASDMLKCYCEPALTKAIKLYGYIEGPRKMYNYELPCQEYLQQYLSKNAALFLAAGTVIVVNLFLQTILRAFADFERHVSESERTSAMVIKLFFAQLLNTGIIVLLVNANLTNVPLPSQVRDILHGQYDDFVRQWYISVGVGISTTMIINAISPQIGPFLKTYIIGPISRWHAIRSAVTQKQMNELYAGPPFDISLRYPLVLNTVFVTMMYCGGIPILLPVASLACFVMFQLDKLTMMRLYSVRTAYDEALGELSLSMLPFALLIHLGFSTWMYGNGTFLQSNLLNVQWVLQQVGFQSVGNATDVNALYEELQNAVSKYDPLGKNGLSSKIWRVNVFPVFLFFLFTIVWLILSKLFGYLLRPIFNSTLGIFLRVLSLLCSSAAKSLKNVLIKRKYSTDHSIIAQYPDFTGEYQVMHLQKSKIVDTTKGFELQDNGVLIRKWTVDTEMRNKGDRMLTWEAMAAPVKTYDIEANPKYKVSLNIIVMTNYDIECSE
ncbi:transmembrane protein [Thraustotheca clavata]|uniref:Transmembrane protein n=1 Tax=Thraustotheca clavata TaxID=74557 RepID=A0A1V9YX85_9STRA|nr:transmembrane protein [Thraustotheca clavata]